jgi:hypothetical protein
MESNSSTYGKYVLYGFERLYANRVAFICRKYEQEIGVGVGLRGNHCAAIGKGYYMDDVNLHHICLQYYLLVTCPPTTIQNKGQGVMALGAPPVTLRDTVLFHTSCMIPVIDMHITLHCSTNSYLHIKHLYELFNAKPIDVPNSEMEDMKEASMDLFQCVDDWLPEDTSVWKCIYSDTALPVKGDDSDNQKIEFDDP